MPSTRLETARAVALALGTLLIASCSGDSARSDLVVRDSLGTTIIEHRNAPGDGVPLLALEDAPSLRIGVTEGGEAYQFFRVSDALRRRDGSVVVLDGSRTIRAYDSTGTHLWTSGGSGEGPGEFSYAQRVAELSGDTLAVWDPGPGRLSLLTATGQYVRALTPAGVAGSTIMLGLADHGRLLLEQRTLERSVINGHNAITVHSELHLLDVSDGVSVAIGRRLNAIQYQEVDANGAFSPPIFGTAAVFAPAPGGFWFGDAQSYEMQRTTAAGPVTIVRWPGPERAVRESDVDAVVKKWGSVPDASPASRQFLEQYRRTHPRAERFPAYEAIQATPDGSLWVQDYVREHEDDEVRRWLVFSPDGRGMIGRLEHSARLTPLRMDLMGVLGVERDEFGVERIVYRRVAP
jgi:hypothetical protein